MHAFVLAFLFIISSSASICFFVSKFSAGFRLLYAIPAVAVAISVLLICVIGYAERLRALIQRGSQSEFWSRLGKDICNVMGMITVAKTTEQSVLYGIASAEVAVIAFCAIFARYEDLVNVAEEICWRAFTAFIVLVFIDFRIHGAFICMSIFPIVMAILRVRQGREHRQGVAATISAAILTFHSNTIDHVKLWARTITTSLSERWPTRTSQHQLP